METMLTVISPIVTAARFLPSPRSPHSINRLSSPNMAAASAACLSPGPFSPRMVRSLLPQALARYIQDHVPVSNPQTVADWINRHQIYGENLMNAPPDVIREMTGDDMSLFNDIMQVATVVRGAYRESPRRPLSLTEMAKELSSVQLPTPPRTSLPADNADIPDFIWDSEDSSNGTAQGSVPNEPSAQTSGLQLVQSTDASQAHASLHGPTVEDTHASSIDSQPTPRQRGNTLDIDATSSSDIDRPAHQPRGRPVPSRLNTSVLNPPGGVPPEITSGPSPLDTLQLNRLSSSIPSDASETLNSLVSVADASHNSAPQPSEEEIQNNATDATDATDAMYQHSENIATEYPTEVTANHDTVDPPTTPSALTGMTMIHPLPFEHDDINHDVSLADDQGHDDAQQPLLDLGTSTPRQAADPPLSNADTQHETTSDEDHNASISQSVGTESIIPVPTDGDQQTGSDSSVEAVDAHLVAAEESTTANLSGNPVSSPVPPTSIDSPEFENVSANVDVPLAANSTEPTTCLALQHDEGVNNNGSAQNNANVSVDDTVSSSSAVLNNADMTALREEVPTETSDTAAMLEEAAVDVATSLAAGDQPIADLPASNVTRDHSEDPAHGVSSDVHSSSQDHTHTAETSNSESKPSAMAYHAEADQSEQPANSHPALHDDATASDSASSQPAKEKGDGGETGDQISEDPSTSSQVSSPPLDEVNHHAGTDAEGTSEHQTATDVPVLEAGDVNESNNPTQALQAHAIADADTADHVEGLPDGRAVDVNSKSPGDSGGQPDEPSNSDTSAVVEPAHESDGSIPLPSQANEQESCVRQDDSTPMQVSGETVSAPKCDTETTSVQGEDVRNADVTNGTSSKIPSAVVADLPQGAPAHSGRPSSIQNSVAPGNADEGDRDGQTGGHSVVGNTADLDDAGFIMITNADVEDEFSDLGSATPTMPSSLSLENAWSYVHAEEALLIDLNDTEDEEPDPSYPSLALQTWFSELEDVLCAPTPALSLIEELLSEEEAEQLSRTPGTTGGVLKLSGVQVSPRMSNTADLASPAGDVESTVNRPGLSIRVLDGHRHSNVGAHLPSVSFLSPTPLDTFQLSTPRIPRLTDEPDISFHSVNTPGETANISSNADVNPSSLPRQFDIHTTGPRTLFPPDDPSRGRSRSTHPRESVPNSSNFPARPQTAEVGIQTDGLTQEQGSSDSSHMQTTEQLQRHIRDLEARLAIAESVYRRRRTTSDPPSLMRRPVSFLNNPLPGSLTDRLF